MNAPPDAPDTHDLTAPSGGHAGDGSAADAAPTRPSSDGILSGVLDVRLREHRSAFRRPTSAPPPDEGMATDAQIEAFRELRTQLMLMAASSSLAQFTTMVVPLMRGSGASFVARNLAAAFTLQQRIALLIDCNFRNPKQHDVLGIEDGGDGLSEFLGEPADVPLERLIRPTSVPGLHIIPAGRSETFLAGRPREQFSSRRMKALMSTLRDEPCYVVLDGPPVEGSPDARILSDHADFVVLVVGYGRATVDAVARAAALFDKRKFAGVVLNELVDPPRQTRALARR